MTIGYNPYPHPQAFVQAGLVPVVHRSDVRVLGHAVHGRELAVASLALRFGVRVRELRAPARAGNHRFWLLSTSRARTKRYTELIYIGKR